jgi:peptide deformylase
VRDNRIQRRPTSVDGARTITTFRDGLARLAGHEIDHLYERLYTRPHARGIEPISVAEYCGHRARDPDY